MIDFKIASANCNTMASKVYLISSVLYAYSLVFLLIQESKLDDNILDSEISIGGYSLFRRDRNASGGGVTIYAKSSLSPVLLANPYDIEAICVSCKVGASNLAVMSLYRSQSILPFDEFTEKISELLSTIAADNIFVGEDLNCDYLTDSPSGQKLNSVMLAFDLGQAVQQSTHGAKLLDHLWISGHLSVLSTDILPPLENKKPGLPVHLVPSATVRLFETMPDPVNAPRSARDYWNADWTSICNRIISWNNA